MKPTARHHGFDRPARVLAHIEAHLDQDLDVEGLSAVAAYSKRHFQRWFRAAFGLGVHRYVTLARLKRASHRLAFRADQPVIEIALDGGYAGPEAFARAFRRELDQSPSAFRRSPNWAPWHMAQAPLDAARRRHMRREFSPAEVRLIDFPATPVAMLRYQGDPALIGDGIRRFIAWRRANALPPATSATFNILWNDPETTPAADFRHDICAVTARPVAPNEHGVVAAEIPGGRCARLRLVGSSDALGPALRFLIAEWLPASGEAARDFPPFVQRVRFFPDVPEAEAVTDVFLPLR